MTTAKLLNAIEKYKEIQTSLSEDVKLFVQDKQHDHADRWKVFVESGFGEHRGWIEHPDGDWDDRINEDRDRHSTVDVTNLRCRYGSDKISEEEWRELEEWAMENFIRSWEVDW